MITHYGELCKEAEVAVLSLIRAMLWFLRTYSAVKKKKKAATEITSSLTL